MMAVWGRSGRLRKKGRWWSSPGFYPGDVSLTVHVPEELARRVTDAAHARHVDPEQVALEAIEAHLPAGADIDALEAFIGSGSSGRREPFNIRQERADLAARKLAEGA